MTGCGPISNGSGDKYDVSSGDIGTYNACGGSVLRSYIGDIGQLASTTNTVYGIYDMSGCGEEYTASSYTTDAGKSSTSNNFTSAAEPPYVDLYQSNVFASTDNGWYSHFGECTWQTCGGQALYETVNASPVSAYDQAWTDDNSQFATSSMPWMRRGGVSEDGDGVVCLHLIIMVAMHIPTLDFEWCC